MSTKPHGEATRFMVVDDDDITARAIKRIMNEHNLADTLMVAVDGQDALEQLDSCKLSDGSLPPFIIILDLKMPRMDGLEFLDRVRNDPIYHKLIIFVLTTSDAPRDVSRAYQKNIAGYVVKENLTDTIRNTITLLRYYTNVVVLPELSDHDHEV